MTCAVKVKLPRYDKRKGWTGGDDRALYAITDTHTGRLSVLPAFGMRGIGPTATVRLATRTEAEEHWQAPLTPGWKVVCETLRGVRRRRSRR